MGLTFQSTHNTALTDLYKIEKQENQYIVALAGNPNTGKSTVFNALTRLRQHTGNWPGKTVVNARGKYIHNQQEYILVDIPGTYSLFAASVEETVARDFICFGNADAVIVVADATCLERNLNLVYQIMELTNNIVLCINLIDEAKKKNVIIDADGIEQALGIPVVLCAARKGIGITELKDTVHKVLNKHITPEPKTVVYDEYIEQHIATLESSIENNLMPGINSRWLALRLLDGDDSFIIPSTIQTDTIDKHLIQSINKQQIRDDISAKIYEQAEIIKTKYIKEDKNKINKDRIIDDYITSKTFGIPLMLLMLGSILWITISGANLPSMMLADFFLKIEGYLTNLFVFFNAPDWLHGTLVLGLYRTLSWVISVMLPPMAIFFPLFTILEDIGYLPRVAFNLDHLFKKACAHGKQCLTMCMGFGCNAAGVISCRIIDSPRERLIAILTNNLVPCNGRFPLLIVIATIFLVNTNYNILPTIAVTSLIVISIGITLLVSYVLSKTILKGIPSTFTLELPPYRMPQFGRVIYTSIIDRTMFVLWRAIIIAAPAGVVIWLFANIYIGDLSILQHVVTFLDPFARLIGLDGYILMAFILGLPANEIVLPILLMSYMSTGSMLEYDSLESLKTILIDNGWTYLTAFNTMLFCLLHWPCGTTLLTIKKETGSWKWTLLSAVIPTIIGIIICFFTAIIFRAIGLG